jgi:Zn-dependent alcohol dehydrogenase
MGSSAKILLVGATSLIVGVYAISLKSVQSAGMDTAQSQMNQMQNERLLDAALSLALDDVKKHGLPAYNDTTQVKGKQALGGTIDYSIIKKSGITAEIDLTIKRLNKNGEWKKVSLAVANVEQQTKKHGYRKIHRGDWRVASVFVKRVKQD